MAENNVQKNIQLEKAQREKEFEENAYAELNEHKILPKNISSMKDYAFGKFTWRDVAFVFACELIPVVLTLPLQAVMPQFLAVFIGLALGAPLSFLSIRHVFTGDLPIEERIKISLGERSQNNLLNWDKTIQDGEYVATSTQSFVPVVEFDENDYIFLPGDKGGFAVLKISVDDMSQAKNSEKLMSLNGFHRMLDALVNDRDCIPIQILLKSVPKNLSEYVNTADECRMRILSENKMVAAVRAADYMGFLQGLDEAVGYYYDYYLVITYREDAEEVGNDTMNSPSVRKKKLSEGKILNPLNKRAQIAAEAEYDIGADRKKQNKELARSANFGRLRTQKALDRRVTTVMTMIRDLGNTHTEIRAELLSKHEITKLIFECYNDTDKHTIDAVIGQAMESRSTIYSTNMYQDFPDLFNPKVLEGKRNDSTLAAMRGRTLGKAY